MENGTVKKLEELQKIVEDMIVFVKFDLKEEIDDFEKLMMASEIEVLQKINGIILEMELEYNKAEFNRILKLQSLGGLLINNKVSGE